MKVHMINSVGENPAGSFIDLPDEMADRFLILGYADGSDLSRVYTDEEKEAILATVQEVSV